LHGQFIHWRACGGSLIQKLKTSGKTGRSGRI
jgi:hypothetical protein